MTDLRFKAEEHAVALLLAGSGLLFAIGLLLEHTGRAIEKAVTLGGPR